MAPTDVEQYKGVDVRCGPVPGGKCLGVQMKHRPHFETLDRRAKYNQIDTEDDGGSWHLWTKEDFGSVEYSLEELLE